MRGYLAQHGPDLDKGSGRQMADLGGNHHPCVRGGQGMDHAGSLGAHGSNQPAAFPHPAIRADQVEAARWLAERLRELGVQSEPVVGTNGLAGRRATRQECSSPWRLSTCLR